jgi:hypothetical protein
MPRSAPVLFVCLFALGCATTAQAPRPAPGSGPPLYVLPQATCSSEGGAAAADMVPDAQLCADLLAALRQSLNDAGYRVVGDANQPHAANARVVAQQHRATDRDDNPTSFVTVQVLIEATGEEIERAAEDGNRADDGGEKAEVKSFASAIANELAHSPRMRRAGLVPGLATPAPQAGSQ